MSSVMVQVTRKDTPCRPGRTRRGGRSPPVAAEAGRDARGRSAADSPTGGRTTHADTVREGWMEGFSAVTTEPLFGPAMPCI